MSEVNTGQTTRGTEGDRGPAGCVRWEGYDINPEMRSQSDEKRAGLVSLPPPDRLSCPRSLIGILIEIFPALGLNRLLRVTFPVLGSSRRCPFPSPFVLPSLRLFPSGTVKRIRMKNPVGERVRSGYDRWLVWL